MSSFGLSVQLGGVGGGGGGRFHSVSVKHFKGAGELGTSIYMNGSDSIAGLLFETLDVS